MFIISVLFWSRIAFILLEFRIGIQYIPVQREDFGVRVSIGLLVPPIATSEDSEPYEVRPSSALSEEFPSPLVQKFLLVEHYRAFRLIQILINHFCRVIALADIVQQFSSLGNIAASQFTFCK